MLQRTYATTPAEFRVDQLAPQVDVQIEQLQARALLAGGLYELSFGLADGRHFRRERGEGCYHLRIASDGRCFLHRDEQDPRRHPVGHFFETPALCGAAAVIGFVALVYGASRS